MGGIKREGLEAEGLKGVDMGHLTWGTGEAKKSAENSKGQNSEDEPSNGRRV